MESQDGVRKKKKFDQKIQKINSTTKNTFFIRLPKIFLSFSRPKYGFLNVIKELSIHWGRKFCRHVRFLTFLASQSLSSLTETSVPIKMSKAETATVRTRRFMKNPLMKRRQMVVDVIHHGRPNVPKAELAERLGQLYHKGNYNSKFFLDTVI